MSRSPGLPTHFTCIDAMRGIAAIFVATYHSTHFFMAEAGNHLIPVAFDQMPYGSVLWPVYTYGEEAVRLFWVISGFVFAHVYWNRPTVAREFAVARFARLYPLHFVTLILVAVMQYVSFQTQGHWQIYGNNDARHFVLHLLLMDTSLTLSEGVSFNVPIWSVSAEIFVYVAFFLSLGLTRARPVMGSLLLGVLSYVILQLRPEGFLIGPWVFACGVFFFAGAACYGAYRAWRGAAGPLIGLVAALVGAVVVGVVWDIFDLALLAGCCALVVSLAGIERRAGGRARGLTFLGDISYSLYLVHMPIQIATLLVVDLWLGGGRGFAASYLMLPLFLGGCIVVAYLVNRYFEKPVGAWLRERLG